MESGHRQSVPDAAVQVLPVPSIPVIAEFAPFVAKVGAVTVPVEVIVPGAMIVLDKESVGVVVLPSELIWLAVPSTEVTVPLPPPPPPICAHVPLWHV